MSEYLNLPFDTGQVVSIDRFIAEYNTNSQSISTPLDNSFHHREVELEELKTIISEENLIILNGAPGVGKSIKPKTRPQQKSSAAVFCYGTRRCCIG